MEKLERMQVLAELEGYFVKNILKIDARVRGIKGFCDGEYVVALVKKGNRVFWKPYLDFLSAMDYISHSYPVERPPVLFKRVPERLTKGKKIEEFKEVCNWFNAYVMGLEKEVSQ